MRRFLFGIAVGLFAVLMGATVTDKETVTTTIGIGAQ
jgi:hypothetical protein